MNEAPSNRTAQAVGIIDWLDAASWQLEKIDIGKLAAAGFPKEATAISAARVSLDKIVRTRRYRFARWWQDFTTEPEGQAGYCGI